MPARKREQFATAQEGVDSRQSQSRLSIPLSPNGGVDWNRIRPTTSAKVFDLLETDPTIQERLQKRYAPVDDEDEPELFSGITQENMRAGLNILSQITALTFRIGVAKFVKHPLLRTAEGRPLPLVIEPDILNAAFTLTEEQHKELDPRATKLAQKYSGNMPEWMKRHLDLIMLVSMFLKYGTENAQAAMSRQIMRDAARMREAMAQQQNRPRVRSDSDVRTQPVNGHDQGTAEEGQPLEPGYVPPPKTESGEGRPAV